MFSKPNQFISLRWILVISIFLGSAVGLFMFIIPTRADVAPPQAPPGANPEVNSITEVRMVDEKVVITVQEEDINDMGLARVWAEFHMMNLGNTQERLMVRFPISYSDGFSSYPEIEDLMVYVDNISVSTAPLALDGDPDKWDDPIKWSEFEVEFPPGEIVEIEVDYTLFGTGEYPFVSYGYLLETGAGWNGTIGKAEIIVRMPYAATAENVFIESSPGWGGTTPGAVLSQNEVIWNFDDFEPDYGNNISIAMVWPSVWQRLLEEQKQVKNFSNDGEAWGRLAKLYKETSRLRKGTREDAGGIALFEMSVEAYEIALEYLPDDALWHAGYADLLLGNSVWDYFSSSDLREQYVSGLHELFTAYTLEPNHPYIQDLLSRYDYPDDAVTEENGEYVFYGLTQTPILLGESSTQTPSATPTVHQLDTISIDEVSVPENGKPLPFCGSVLLFPLFLGIIVIIPGIGSKIKRSESDEE